MDVALKEEQVMMAETARQIGRKYGLEYWREMDAGKQFPKELWQAICDAGFCGVALPEEYGGAGLGMTEMVIIIEALAASGGGSTLGQLFMCNPIFGGISVSKFGTPEQKRAWLPPLIRGEINFCMALTEPDAGSNSLSMKTFATPDGDGWRLNGQKIWITAVPQSKKMLVIARTKKPDEIKRRTEGISMFVIDVERTGLEHQPIEKHGTNTLPSSIVYFDNVRIEPNELVGTLHNGWYELLDVLNTERIVTTAGLVGTGELAIKLAVDYAKERCVFGKTPIAAYQGLQFPLAHAYAQLECARVMNRFAAGLCDAGRPYGAEANIAKLIAAEAATAATDRAMQTMGGMGYAKEYHVERLARDARLFRIAPVSEEMILNFIAMNNLGMPRSY
jgi:acyl-CoA dehydrogenase